MQASAIAKVEAGDRRVDVDDLAVFSVALNAPVGRLLLPDVNEETDLVRVVPNVPVPAWSAWQWATGQHSHTEASEDIRGDTYRLRELEYAAERPPWERLRYEHPLSHATRHLAWSVRRAVGASDAGNGPVAARWLRKVDQAVDGLRREVERLTEEIKIDG